MSSIPSPSWRTCRRYPELATGLGDMFRYNISGGSLVTVMDEITQIERYANIQKLYMAGRIETVLMFRGGQRKKILKFLLQPLVEKLF